MNDSLLAAPLAYRSIDIAQMSTSKEGDLSDLFEGSLLFVLTRLI